MEMFNFISAAKKINDELEEESEKIKELDQYKENMFYAAKEFELILGKSDTTELPKNTTTTESGHASDENTAKPKLVLSSGKNKKKENDLNKQLNQLKKEDSGIYIFISGEANVTIPKDFNKVKCSAKVKRKYESVEIDPKRCLYVGKSNSIKERLKQHLYKECKGQYSLRCSHKNRRALFKGAKIYVFVLKNDYKAYEDIILPRIESKLHDKLDPIIGTSRA